MNYIGPFLFEIELGKQRTATVFADDHFVGSPASEPVLGLRRVPSGETFRFDDYTYEGRPKRWIVVGTSRYCDVVLDDDDAQTHHALILRHKGTTTLRSCRPSNVTMLNCADVETGTLAPGVLITLGRTTFVAYGERGARERIWIGARSLREFILNAKRLYRSERQAALALGVVPNTFRNWVTNERFEIAEDQFTW